jgi:hypothetical protein
MTVQWVASVAIQTESTGYHCIYQCEKVSLDVEAMLGKYGQLIVI